MRIGVFQFAGSADIAANGAAIGRAIRQAADKQVRLLVFHECAACGYPPLETPDIHKIDYEALDALHKDVCRSAKEHGMYIALGTIRQQDGRCYNTVRLISPEGNIIGSYDKRALWGWDLDHFNRGESLGVFEIDGITVGFRICFEIRFPEYFRELFEAGVELCFVSFCDVAKADSSARHNIISSHLLTRAVENAMSVISVNSTSGRQTAPTAVFNRGGLVEAKAPKDQEHLLIYDFCSPEPAWGTEGIIKNARLAMKKEV